MTPDLVFSLPGNEAMAASLASRLGAETGTLESRHFPDGESYLRLVTPVAGRHVLFVCTLDRPDAKFLPLLFAAATARELGAMTVCLAAPYLAYLRQDRRFQAGEAVTSRQAAKLLGDAFDRLVCVDPHLHRYHDLAEIFAIPALALHAAPLLASWVAASVERPLLIGPDRESEQWVSAVAKRAGAPFAVLDKIRHGDRDVEILLPELRQWEGHTPVLMDDIISTGRTMLEAIRLLRVQGFARPVCLAVHGLFADGADMALKAAGARVITCNTVPHACNAIDVSELLASGFLKPAAATAPSRGRS